MGRSQIGLTAEVSIQVLNPETHLIGSGADLVGRMPENGVKGTSLVGRLGIQPLGGDRISLGTGEKEEGFKKGGFWKRLTGKGLEGLVEDIPDFLKRFEVKEIAFIEAGEGRGSGQGPVGVPDAAMELFRLKVLEKGGFPIVALLDEDTSGLEEIRLQGSLEGRVADTGEGTFKPLTAEKKNQQEMIFAGGRLPQEATLVGNEHR